MRPFYVVAPVQQGMEIDRDLLRKATKLLFACGHQWAEVHIAHEADA